VYIICADKLLLKTRKNIMLQKENIFFRKIIFVFIFYM